MLDNLKREIELNGVQLETVVLTIVCFGMIGLVIYGVINTLQTLINVI